MRACVVLTNHRFLELPWDFTLLSDSINMKLKFFLQPVSLYITECTRYIVHAQLVLILSKNEIAEFLRALALLYY